MAEIIGTIVPIFIVIFIGTGLKRLGLLPAGFVGTANRLVYYVAIPAMVFRVVAIASFTDHFNLVVVLCTLAPIVLITSVSWFGGRALKYSGGRMGTFIQGGFHGNLGYVGLAVAYYYLGDAGLANASIVAGFMMLLQNFQAVFVYSAFQTSADGAEAVKPDAWQLGKKIVLHPVILSALAGMIVSLLEIPLPVIFDRSLKILGGMALPLALLLIGAGISLKQMRGQAPAALAASAVKLIALPALGLGFYLVVGLESEAYLPSFILLASPAATMVYVLAREMGGDPELGTAVVSITTLLSAVTFTAWLSFLG